MSDPAKLRACASALRHLHEREPSRRTLHLARWAEREAEKIEQVRLDLETWPAPERR